MVYYIKKGGIVVMYKKILVSFFVTFFAFISLSFFSVAKAEVNTLTNEEKRYLYDVLNFTDMEVNTSSVEEARFLIENEAKVVSEFNEVFQINEPYTSIEEITPLGAISTSDLSFSGKVLSIQSTVSGYKGFYAYANYDWLNRPYWRLTDKISIGFPNSLGVYMTTNNSGNVTGHSGSHWIYNTQTGTTTEYASTSSTSDADPSGGVASAFNLHGTINVNHRLQGRVTQTFYVKNSLSGKANVKFEYGHKTVSGSPTIQILPSSGLGITPTGNIDVRSYFGSFDY